MQDQTIILHNHTLFSIKTTRIVFAVLGILLITLDVYLIIQTGKIGFPSNLFWGIFLLATSIFVLSENSSFSPKIKITKTGILLKNGFWSRTQNFNWQEIKGIDLGSYKIYFELSNANHKFAYNTSAEVSVQIKHALRDAAKIQNISVTVG